MQINYGSYSSSLELFSDEDYEMADFIVPDESESEKRPHKRLKKRDVELMEEDSEFELDTTIMQRLCLFPKHSRGAEVIGRDLEAHAMIEMMELPQGGIRPLLLGPVGIGKKSIVEKVAYLYKTTFKNQFPNREVYCLDSCELLATTNRSGDTDGVAEELSKLVEEAHTESDKPVIYFKEIDRLLKFDHIRDYLLSIFKTPYPFAASISNGSNEEGIKALMNVNFKPLTVRESPTEDVIKIVTNHLNNHQVHPDLKVTKLSVDFAINLAEKYDRTHPFPRKAINLIQQSANRLLLGQNRPKGKVFVQPQHIAEFVGSEVGIPAADLLDEAVFDKKRFANKLKSQVVGQDHAIEVVSQRVACYKQGLLSSNKPWGVFLFIGSTGVGKTELAKQLSKQLYHEETAFYRIDGSEFRESHTTSRLIGAPPGYEGHDAGGQFTEALKKHPHMVVLVDEVEKAHEEVRMLFLQVFRDGILTDRQGTTVDCSKALFILTSNLGSEELFKASGKKSPSPEEVKQKVMPILVENLRAEFCNRCSEIIPFQPLKKENIPDVIAVQLERIKARLKQQTEINLKWQKSLIDHFFKEGFDPRFGMSKLCETVDDTVTKVLQMATAEINQPLKGDVTLVGKKGEIGVKLKKGGV